ncbi:MAG: anti-sigma B factor antagonist [Parvicella sp.]|jgi:anti-sigma B factor antagonist
MQNVSNPLQHKTEVISDEYIKVVLQGRITESASASSLVSEVTGLLSPEMNQVIIDLKEIDYINSNGLNSLIAILTKTRTRGGDMVIFDVNSKIEKLLLITKLNTVFNIAKTEKEAIEILKLKKQN